MKPIQIDGCEHYTINNEGVVVNTQTGRVLKTDLNSSGYKRVTLWSKEQKRVRFLVHRLVASHFTPNPENQPFVNHIDGNKLNNHHTNLEWCSCKDNTLHAFNTGLRKDTKKYVDLKTAQIIREFHKMGVPRKKLMDVYKLPKHVVDEILYNRRSYKYLT